MTMDAQRTPDEAEKVTLMKKPGLLRKWWGIVSGERRRARRRQEREAARAEKKRAQAENKEAKKQLREQAKKQRMATGISKSVPDVLRFQGDYSTWQKACDASAGYDSPIIYETTRDAILKVSCGEAVFERDSVLFDEPQYPFSTIAGLLHAACYRGGKLSVLDFGGSLGSSYFACRPWLDTVKELSWSVVEQSHYVECGRREIETDRLKFHLNSKESVEWRKPDIILMSGVLQFLADWAAMLDELLRIEAPFFYLERTPFWDGTRNRIVVQHVPADIYSADYPARLFCEAELLRLIEARNYEPVASFPGFDVIPLEGGRSYFKGILFRLKAARES